LTSFTVLSVEDNAFHLSFAYVVVDGNSTIGAEDVQFALLTQSIVDRLGHGMPLAETSPEFLVL
jgi:hypothetical protein